MTFLQPFILWGLPLALLPLVIHLLNRMRYRSVHWAAMSFLMAASRASTRYEKLRQILILACRVLALTALIFMLARPLAGGWLGWMLSPAPDVILVLFDRSASMSAKDEATQKTKREQALDLIARAAGDYREKSRFVLLDSALRNPQEVGAPEMLPSLPQARATDTSADIPALLDAAADWLARNQTGLAEIWIASDLQRSNWDPESDRWKTLAPKIAAIPQGVRVRLLALNQPVSSNSAVAIYDVERRDRAGQPQVSVVVDIQRSDATPATVPVAFTFGGARSQRDVKMEGQQVRLQQVFNVDPGAESGWGGVELPADANAHDNTAYFVHRPRPALRVALVAPDETSRRILQFAAAPAPKKLLQTCNPVTGDLGAVEWDKNALVIWQAPLPTGAIAQKLQEYVETGGIVIFFPPGQQTEGAGPPFADVAWGEVQTAESQKQFRVTAWDEQDGPLARSEEGLSLPVADLQIIQRQVITGDQTARASFSDGLPFLAQRTLGKGQMFFCATLPKPEWSNLQGGQILVPMLQRLFQRGGRRLGGSFAISTADAATLDPSSWNRIDSEERGDIRLDAGIYRSGSDLKAVNRPTSEDEPDKIDALAAKQLFAPVSVQLFEETQNRSNRLQGEIWRMLLGAMLAFLLIEALLTLPGQSVAATKPKPPRPNPEQARRPVEMAGSAT